MFLMVAFLNFQYFNFILYVYGVYLGFQDFTLFLAEKYDIC